MTTHSNPGRQPRPLEHLIAAGKRYPGAWEKIDVFRQGRGKDLPNWPNWCFLPMTAWYAIVSASAGMDRLPLHLIGDVSNLAALGAWRYTQGIYRLDPDLYAAIKATIPSGRLPCDVLLRIPEWSLYIETPEMQWAGDALHGFWAYLEWDVKTHRKELRLLLDTNRSLMSISVYIGNWTITEAIDRYVSEVKKQARAENINVRNLLAHENVEKIATSIYPLVSLLLYVCSNGMEYSGNHPPSYPQPKRTKKGWHLFPAVKPRVWNLGEKVGNAIRGARNLQSERKGPAPHIRRAHWHGYWSGPRAGKQEFNLKWLPPTIIAAGIDDE